MLKHEISLDTVIEMLYIRANTNHRNNSVFEIQLHLNMVILLDAANS